MSIDLFGPADAGAVRTDVSPVADTADAIATDSFFRPCSGGEGTGTPVTARWLNRIVRNLRAAVRRNGIPESNADPELLLRAIRSGRAQWVTFAGTTNAWSAALNPASLSGEIGDGSVLVGLAPFAPTGATTLAVDGGAATPVQWGGDLSAITASTVVSGQLIALRRAGANWLMQQGLSPTQVGSMLATQASIPGRTQIFTASGTFTVPAGVTQVEVVVIGGGGAGACSGDGSGGGIAGNVGAGGGSGGYGYKRISGLTSGAAITVTVGTGGVANTSSTSGSGGSSSFGAYITSAGGGGGTWGVSTKAAGGTGGAVTGADLPVAGASGGLSGPNTNTPSMSDVIVLYSRGGQAAGGLSTISLGGTGNAGQGYGAGGTGASGGSLLAGGNGAPGIVIVRW